MRDLVVARRYARAAYKLSHGRGDTEDVLAGLESFTALFRGNDEFRRMLVHPAVPVAEKTAVVQKIVGDPSTRDFLKFLIERDRLVLLPAVLNEFRDEYRKDAGIAAARITSAVPIPDDVKERLAAAIGHMTGKRVELEAVVDEDVIGGISLRIGDHLIDATLATRLGEIRDAMAGSAE
jgi:F-type H+-transporting ATPase subunit delta